MNLHTTGIIISREYLNKVKKKSFLITTFLVPILFAALCILPSLIMLGTKESSKNIAVVDNSGIVAPALENSETATYTLLEGEAPEDVKLKLESLGYDALLVISPLDETQKTVTADVYSNKPLGMDLNENINGKINSAVENYRIEQSGIANLEEVMKEVKANVKLHSYTLDAEGKEKVSESGVYMMVSMILGMIIYMFIALFGGMVMSSVIEEKASRVVEVLVSSVKATELMFGKIIGVALVALTQFFLWIVLTLSIVGIVGAVAGKDLLKSADPAEMVQTVGGMSAEQSEAVVQAVSDQGEMGTILSTISNLPFVKIIVCFVLFFIFGYMLYASLFAAIGSAVENEGDTQQLQIPITIPLLLGFFIAIYAFKAPDSALVFWGSMIPFTSPIVMLARLPFGVPTWELVVSIILLIATFAVCAWISAKIYKVGILMFGKKSTWKDLWKWLKQK
ncbi:MAG: ABC transporter permease [Bacteroidales bacterium]|nr:ABC transporter permease [Bacteroidales bacterium]MBQ2108026.1 ABC transporter permease [Bacteroidales bacterium]MBQ2229388.1 ABC transporter permease [Bacteroidales bacterium]MBQ2543704.1 ABC transporter permease [Bacteroidales bacterium]